MTQMHNETGGLITVLFRIGGSYILQIRLFLEFLLERYETHAFTMNFLVHSRFSDLP